MHHRPSWSSLNEGWSFVHRNKIVYNLQLRIFSPQREQSIGSIVLDTQTTRPDLWLAPTTTITQQMQWLQSDIASNVQLSIGRRLRGRMMHHRDATPFNLGAYLLGHFQSARHRFHRIILDTFWYVTALSLQVTNKGTTGIRRIVVLRWSSCTSVSHPLWRRISLLQRCRLSSVMTPTMVVPIVWSWHYYCFQRVKRQHRNQICKISATAFLDWRTVTNKVFPLVKKRVSRVVVLWLVANLVGVVDPRKYSTVSIQRIWMADDFSCWVLYNNQKPRKLEALLRRHITRGPLPTLNRYTANI